MDAAYNLARWLVRDDHDAQDVVQEAYLRALRFAGGFRGGDPRAWILAIVRNTAFTWLKRNRGSDAPTEFDEQMHGGSTEDSGLEADAVRKADGAMIRAALEELADEFREVIVMRDIEGLSYKEIADAADVPIGTVMSRLARARGKLARSLKERIAQGANVNCDDARAADAWPSRRRARPRRDLEVQRHIEECPRCASEYAALRAMRTRLKDETFRFEAPAALKEKIRRAIPASDLIALERRISRGAEPGCRAQSGSRCRWRLARCSRWSSRRARLLRRSTSASRTKWSPATCDR